MYIAKIDPLSAKFMGSTRTLIDTFPEFSRTASSCFGDSITKFLVFDLSLESSEERDSVFIEAFSAGTAIIWGRDSSSTLGDLALFSPGAVDQNR